MKDNVFSKKGCGKMKDYGGKYKAHMPMKTIKGQREEIKHADRVEGNKMHEGENGVHEGVNNMWRWEIKDYGKGEGGK